MSMLPRRKDKDLEDEICGHLQMAVRELTDRGESQQQAEASARREWAIRF